MTDKTAGKTARKTADKTAGKTARKTAGKTADKTVRKTADKTADKTAGKMLKVTLKKSTIGRLKSHKACVAGLGLKKIRQTVEVEDTPSVRGMVNKAHYLLSVEADLVNK